MIVPPRRGPLLALLLCALPAAAQIPRPSPRGDVVVGGNPQAEHLLPFLEDDYPRALETARAARKLLFVDAWATWCHTCLSMKRFVLDDPGLGSVRDAVVWLAIETEADRNREFVEKYPLDGLPTFFLVDPEREEVAARWLGAATANELRAFVQENAAAFAARQGGGGPALLAARQGDRARQRNDLPGAVAGYREAVRRSAASDPQRPERLVLLASALARLGTPEAVRECAALGLAEMGRTGSSAVAADFASVAASCGSRLPAGHRDGPRLRAAAEARLAALAADLAAPLSVDDRSDALANLAELQQAAGRAAAAQATLRTRAALLERAAAAAPDPFLASTFDAHRTDTYLALGEPEKAEKMLEERSAQMPEDYNPSARLARVLLEEGKLGAAEAAANRALRRMTRGPRRASLLQLKERILRARDKPRGEVLREELDVLRALPSPQRKPARERELEAELRALGEQG